MRRERENWEEGEMRGKDEERRNFNCKLLVEGEGAVRFVIFSLIM